MKKLTRFLRFTLLSLVSLVLLLIIAYWAFVSFYPSFGGEVTEQRKILYETSRQFQDGVFVNTRDVPKDPSLSEILTISKRFFFTKVENARPDHDLTVKKLDSLELADYQSTRLIWFGHSAFLLQMEGYNILIDPMFGNVPAPHPWLGDKRFSKQLPIEIEQLPRIDALLISHDHYDHLDYGSIKSLKDKIGKFYVPLGVGVHLEEWGVPKADIKELDWWDEVSFNDLLFICAPAQHFSGRKFDTRQSTLWSSWIIKSDSVNIYFSGDGGYAEHFKEIGKKYGPFDFAMLECGQYNELWPDIHMFPEETVQAAVDLGAKIFMPIHWGAFKLALHSWTDPVERVSKKARALQVPMVTPQIGAPIELDSMDQPTSNWWKTGLNK